MHWIKRNGISRTQPIVCIYSHIFRYEIALAWKFNELKQIALLLCAVLLNDDGRCGWIIKKPSHTCIQTIQVEYSFFSYLRGFIVLVLFLWFNENVETFYFVALFALKKRQRLHTKKMREKCIQSIKTDYKQQIFDFCNYIEIHMPWRMWGFFHEKMRTRNIWQALGLNATGKTCMHFVWYELLTVHESKAIIFRINQNSTELTDP